MPHLPRLALFALLSLPGAAFAQGQPFHVTNRTGGDAKELNAVRTPRGATADWGRNLLSPDRPLTSGAGFRVNPAEAAGCHVLVVPHHVDVPEGPRRVRRDSLAGLGPHDLGALVVDDAVG